MPRSKIIKGLKEAARHARGIERCAWHKPDNFSYTHAHIDAEERMARGEKQRQCAKCFLWYWPHEWGNEPEGKPT